ncbi:MAG TPA: gluconate 2-dehydrogenase subunit 3 family protein [Saprospiraceae bacterium]|nr:gluconate 2-dehydrogenase subunit 3 family protein [Saprospiraceae bacterium]HMQ83872.1 gluconate 2-dehydrogenase subunit 3 family protein [Saprospiraceae bacterium]
MDRREALALATTILGGTLVGAELFLSGCKSESKSDPTTLFSVADIQLMDEIGETILPDSDRSPGAKAAQIGAFMQVIVADCYDEAEQQLFTSGLAAINSRAKTEYGKSFLEMTSTDRTALLTHFDREARDQKEAETPHFFAMMRELTIWGYFTSEPGATKALRYNPIPGRFEGCVDYQPEQPAWF